MQQAGSASGSGGGRGDGPVQRRAIAAKLSPRVSPHLARGRLDALLSGLWDHRLGLVIAPAGYGKTSLLAAFATAAGVPVAWYRADGWDASAADLLAHLESAVRRSAVASLGEVPWRSVEDAVAGLEAALDGGRALLVVDDLHTLEGTEAEQVLERLVEYAPSGLAILAASRSAPTINLSRLRVDGALLEIGTDELRFRSWEVEELFRDLYEQRISPEELAELARRTDGWAAGLQLFHLATRGRTPDERRRVLTGLARHSRLVREYLTRNLLEQLPAELRHFLVGTSVLGRLSGPLCDRFLGRTGSAAMLAELERRRLFIDSVDGDDAYALHEVLRSHLEEVLLAERGEEAARECFRRAAEVLVQAGAWPEALRALCRAEDWDAASRLLGGQGSALVDQPGRWLDALPEPLIENDPWLLVAWARRHRAEGRWDAAVDAFRRVEHGFPGSRAAEVSRVDRMTLAAFLSPASAVAPPDHWLGRLRQAVSRDPAGAERDPGPAAAPPQQLVDAVVALLRGRLRLARASAREVAQSEASGMAISTAALILSGAAGLLTGDERGAWELSMATDRAERAALVWLGRMARAARALEPGGREVAAAGAVAALCRHDGDRWGEALARLAEGWGSLRCGQGGGEALQGAADLLDELGAVSIAAWARSLAALAAARAADPGARAAAVAAERLARQVGVAAAAGYAHLALAVTEPARAAEFTALARSALEEALPGDAASPGAPAATDTGAAVTRGLVIRCFGGLRVLDGARELDLTAIKPRVRSLLRLLAAQAGEPVHWEVIAAALWPEADLATANRNLRVAVSSLRQHLEPEAQRGGWSVLVRSGEAYRLAVPEAAACDVQRLHRLLGEARTALATGRLDDAVAAFTTALDVCAAPLLPEEGPCEWLAEPRQLMRTRACETAELLAAALLAAGDPARAARVSDAGLRVEPAHDPLWRVLIDARRRSGDHAAAERAVREYRGVLADLGIDAPLPI